MDEKKKYIISGIIVIILSSLVIYKPDLSYKNVKHNIVDFYIKLGQNFQKNEQYDMSNFYYRVAKKIEPRVTGTEYNIAKNIVDKHWGKSLNPQMEKQLKEGLMLLKKAQEDSPNNINIWWQMANTYYKLEDYESAAYYYEKVVEKSPNWEWGIHQLAYIYNDAFHDHEKALEYINRAVAIDNDCTLKYFLQGCILADLERKEEAIDAYKKYLEFEPDSVAALVNISGLEIGVKDWENAKIHNERGLELNPYSAYLLEHKFDILMHEGKYDEAEEIARGIAERRLYNGYIGYWRLAYLEKVRGNFEKAEEYFEMARTNAQEYYDKYCEKEYDLSDKDGNCSNRFTFLRDFDKYKNELPDY